jgi:hypothetical protein
MSHSLLLIPPHDHYWVTKNPCIHGSVVLLFGTLKVRWRATKLVFLYYKIMHFLQVLSQKPFHVFFVESLTLQHHLEPSFTHSTLKHTMGLWRGCIICAKNLGVLINDIHKSLLDLGLFIVPLFYKRCLQCKCI